MVLVIVVQLVAPRQIAVRGIQQSMNCIQTQILKTSAPVQLLLVQAVRPNAMMGDALYALLAVLHRHHALIVLVLNIVLVVVRQGLVTLLVIGVLGDLVAVEVAQ